MFEDYLRGILLNGFNFFKNCFLNNEAEMKTLPFLSINLKPKLNGYGILVGKIRTLGL